MREKIVTGIDRIIPEAASWTQTLFEMVPPVLSGSNMIAKVVTVIDPTGGKVNENGVSERTSGKRSRCQANMKATMPAAMRPGLASGITISKNDLVLE
jgi:hypothetical protein